MKRRMICVLLAFMLIVSLIPATPVFAAAKATNNVEVWGIIPPVVGQSPRSFHTEDQLRVPTNAVYKVVSEHVTWRSKNNKPIKDGSYYTFEAGRAYTVTFAVVIHNILRDQYCFDADVVLTLPDLDPSSYTVTKVELSGNNAVATFTVEFMMPGNRTYPDIEAIVLDEIPADHLSVGGSIPYQRHGVFTHMYGNFSVNKDDGKSEVWRGYTDEGLVFGPNAVYTYTCVFNANAGYRFSQQLICETSNPEFVCISQSVSQDRKTATVTYRLMTGKGVTVIDQLNLKALEEDSAQKSRIYVGDAVENSAVAFLADADALYTERAVSVGSTPYMNWHNAGNGASAVGDVFRQGESYYFDVTYDLKSEAQKDYVFADLVTASIQGGGFKKSDYTVTVVESLGYSVTLRFTCQPNSPEVISTADIWVDEPKPGVVPLIPYNIPEPATVSYLRWTGYDGSGTYPDAREMEAGKSYKLELAIVIPTQLRNHALFSDNVAVLINNNKASVAAYTDNVGKGILITYDFGQCPSMVSRIDLTVTPPREGQVINYTVDSANSKAYKAVGRVGVDRPDYMTWYESEDQVVWNRMFAGDTFREGMYYRVCFDVQCVGANRFPVDSITADTLQPAVTATVNGMAARVIKAYDQSPSEYVTVSVDFGMVNDSAIETVAIDGVTAPLAGDIPNYYCNLQGTGYLLNTAMDNSHIQNGMGWWDYTGDQWVLPGEKFLPGHQYKVVINLKTQSGYEFYTTGNAYVPNITATINGNGATLGNMTLAQYEQKLSYIFTCQPKQVSTVQVFDLSMPVPGDKPDFTASTPYPELYKVDGIQWFDDDMEEMTTSDTFKKGSKYYVLVTVVPVTEGSDYACKFVNQKTTGFLNGKEIKKDRDGWDEVTSAPKRVRIFCTYSLVNYASIPSTGWWQDAAGSWYYFQNGTMVRNQWRRDSVGWCYLGADGAMVTNAWVTDSKGWCYVGADGYCLTNTFKTDSVGYVWLDGEGSMVYNQWILYHGKWYYIDGEGYRVANQWRRDSVGWCYLGADGAMVTNAWVTDSKGWCYVGADGYCLTNTFKADSVGYVWLDGEGSMAYNQWVLYQGKWYYVDGNGYRLESTSLKWNGKTYYFNASGVCTNP